MQRGTEEFLDRKSAFYNGNESDNDDESYHENYEQQQCYWRVLPIVDVK